MLLDGILHVVNAFRVFGDYETLHVEFVVCVDLGAPSAIVELEELVDDPIGGGPDRILARGCLIAQNSANARVFGNVAGKFGSWRRFLLRLREDSERQNENDGQETRIHGREA